MAHQDAAKFSEVVALIQRNEHAERSAGDAEQDLRRVLLMARDAQLRDQMVQFQAVRRIAAIWSASRAATTHRYCAGILGNLAQSERGRLSASSCDRHFCPLFVMLSNAQCSPDAELQHVSAAALLAFSIQNECQIQIDAISGIPTLLRLLDVNDADLCIYAAAIMWNICKSPLLMLKLETTHGILKDQLEQRLTDILATSLEPFHLFTRPTGERGISGIIESDCPENLNLLISCSISTQLSVVLHVENYTGHSRSLTDQFSSIGAKGSKRTSQQQQGKSVAHFDESGVLIARTCAACSKSIKVTRKSARGTFLLCAKEECGQTYHINCSRWAQLDEDDVHPEHFHCDRCVLLLPLYYWDFVAEREQHEELLSENLFKSVAITRVQPQPQAQMGGGDAPPLAMLFNRKQQLIGVGAKCFRVARSSKDAEMFVVTIKFSIVTAYPATHQVASFPVGTANSSNNVATDADDLDCDWQVSYAREDADRVEFIPGNALFWPASYLVDVAPLLYTERSLVELENAWVYEFRGDQAVDKMFSIGAASLSPNDSDGVAIGGSSSATVDKLSGLWTSLYPRKGVCMKVLAEQIGRAKQLCEAQSGAGNDRATLATASAKPTSASHKSSSRKKRAKPHFPGKKLNKVAVTTL